MRINDTMKNSKKILLALFIAASAGSFTFSSVAVAEEGRTSFSPTTAIDNVANKIDAALAAIADGKDHNAVAAIINEVKALTKEINASDKVAFKTSQARNEVKHALAEAKNGDLKTAAENLTKAKADFIALKSLL